MPSVGTCWCDIIKWCDQPRFPNEFHIHLHRKATYSGGFKWWEHVDQRHTHALTTTSYSRQIRTDLACMHDAVFLEQLAANSLNRWHVSIDADLTRLECTDCCETLLNMIELCSDMRFCISKHMISLVCQTWSFSTQCFTSLAMFHITSCHYLLYPVLANQTHILHAIML